MRPASLLPSALVASIIHEIGQPLSAVETAASAAARWLQRPEPDLGEALAMLAQTALSARRARRIIQGLRAMARQGEPQFARVDVDDALREAVALVGADLAGLGARLDVQAPGQPCFVHGDRVQLQQVAINLLTNGAEAMGHLAGDARRLAIRWGASASGRSVEVVVEDRGTGIAPEVAARVLEPFFTTKASGTGLGLAICRSIVDAHGGTLGFEPGAAVGTRVTVRLPRLGGLPHACGQFPDGA